MNDDEMFRMQVEQAAEFVTATYAFDDDELDAYLTQYNNAEKFQNAITGMQALLTFSLNKIAQLDGTHSGDVQETTLRKLQEIMLNFHQYDTMDKE